MACGLALQYWQHQCRKEKMADAILENQTLAHNYLATTLLQKNRSIVEI
jgi:hypothetical protein